MKKSKYYVVADGVGYYSNSRNARKHLIETGAHNVTVFANDWECDFVSRAVRTNDCIMFGARREK